MKHKIKSHRTHSSRERSTEKSYNIDIIIIHIRKVKKKNNEKVGARMHSAMNEMLEKM